VFDRLGQDEPHQVVIAGWLRETRLVAVGDPVGLLDSSAALAAPVADEARRTRHSLIDVENDWLATGFATAVVADRPLNWRPGEPKIRHGERLFAFCRVDLAASRAGRPPETKVLPLEVVDLSEHMRIDPSRAFIVQAPLFQDRFSPGWSGSFVGRYDAEADEWEFLGFLAMVTVPDPFKRRLLYVVRPPDDVLDWLLHGTPINPEHTVEARLEQWRERLGDPL
jgi:hypothetical protein